MIRFSITEAIRYVYKVYELDRFPVIRWLDFPESPMSEREDG